MNTTIEHLLDKVTIAKKHVEDPTWISFYRGWLAQELRDNFTLYNYLQSITKADALTGYENVEDGYVLRIDGVIKNHSNMLVTHYYLKQNGPKEDLAEFIRLTTLLL